MTWLTSWWTDLTKRATLIRFAVGGIGYLIKSGVLVLPDQVYQYISDPGFLAMLTGLLIPSSVLQPKPTPAPPVLPVP